MFEDLIKEYAIREPQGTDTWNPLRNELELWHRVKLFITFKSVLEQLDLPISEIRALDVGCGVGRSTRALLEFGLSPENLVGIDLRASAISRASYVNPAIDFRVVEGLNDWPAIGSFDLCMQCTVFGSIRGLESRLALAEMMEKAVRNNGYIFWWDSILANRFAGGDLIDPRSLFRNCKVVNYWLLSLRPSLGDAVNLKGRAGWLIQIFQRLFGFPETHCAAVFQKHG